jgi:hypothetical protein
MVHTENHKTFYDLVPKEQAFGAPPIPDYLCLNGHALLCQYYINGARVR